ncbi:MAG: hypothetical protein Fues2KO_49640 [Fuerstiella sp.]
MKVRDCRAYANRAADGREGRKAGGGGRKAEGGEQIAFVAAAAQAVDATNLSFPHW